MTDQQKEAARGRIKEYLSLKGITWDSSGLTNCINPAHHDNNPSFQIWETGYKCHSLCGGGDIFKAAGLLISSDKFPDQMAEVCQVLGITEDKDFPRAEKVVNHNSGVRKKVIQSAPIVAVPPGEYKQVWNGQSVERLRQFAEKNRPGSWGDRIAGTWPYQDINGNYLAFDVRFEGGDRSKNVVTIYYDGKNIRSSFPDPENSRKRLPLPVLIYNLPGLIQEHREGKKILLHEGAKCARLAIGVKIPGFVSGSWSGGSKKAHMVDFKDLVNAGITKFWYYPDRDLKQDKNGKILPEDKQPGMMAAFELQKNAASQGLECHIIPPYPGIPGDGADIEQVIMAAPGPQEIADYINNTPEVQKLDKKNNASGNDKKINYEEKDQAKGLNPDAFPFHILGTGDDGFTYFVGRGDRMHAWSLESISKGKLMQLAPQSFWMSMYPEAGARWNEPALSDIIEVAANIDFDPDLTRGRGAYWNDQGEPYYFNGREYIGIPSKKCIHIRKRCQDIGISSPPATLEIRQKMREVAGNLSFRSLADMIRLMGWAGITWASGLLRARPPVLITGDAGGGKSYITEQIINVLACPICADTNTSTPVGILNRIGNDTPAVTIDEADKDSKGKQEKVTEYYNLIRSGYTEGAPKGYKGLADGRYRTQDPKAMFLLAAVDPTVQHSADESRIIRIFIDNDSRPGESREERIDRFQPIDKEVRSLFTEANARAVRAFTWMNIKAILENAEKMEPAIGAASGQAFRGCQAEAILLSTYLIVFEGILPEAMTEERVKSFLDKFYTWSPVEEKESSTGQMLDQLLQHIIKIDAPRVELTVRGICDIVNRGYYIKDPAYVGDDEEVANTDLKPFRTALGNLGLAVISPREDGGNYLAIMKNNTQLMRALHWSRGYHYQAGRHELCVKKPGDSAPEMRNCNIPGQGTKVCLIFDIFGGEE